MNPTRRASLVAVLASALAPAAGAATICVSPAGGSCLSSIQAAVDQAGPGDIIRIAAGNYAGGIVVPAGKDGLVIQGASRLTTLIDANGSDGINVFADAVQIQKLAVRGADKGITLEGQGALVSGTRIVGSRDGIWSGTGSDGHRIVSNEIRSIFDNGILVTGEDAVVQGNTITQAFRGIHLLEAKNAQVLTNRLSGVEIGILVSAGTSPVLSGNTIDVAGTMGLSVQAASPVVRANKLTNASAQVQCTSCGGAIVEGNSVKGSLIRAMTFTSDEAGLVVRTNTVTGSRGPAFEVQGAPVELTSNTATDGGSFDSALGCYAIFGSGHYVVSNKSIRCGRSAFWVEAIGVNLQANTSAGAGGFGFNVFGDGGVNYSNYLTNNRADASNAGGFAVTGDAGGTTLSNNSGTKNRYDFCDDGTGTITQGTAFATVSTACDLSPWR